MKLIPLIDFVLKEGSKPTPEQQYFLICDYAEFLKQPLKLEMFIPCDEHNNVLKSPTDEQILWFNSQKYGDFSEKYSYLFDYLTQKSKVLFKGFNHSGDDFEDYIIFTTDYLEFMFDRDENRFVVDNGDYPYKIIRTVEDLVKYNLELTNTAIRKLQWE